MQWTDRRRQFRTLLKGGDCVHPGSVFDPVSARFAERLGFELAMFAGSVASMTVLGAPDLTVLTLSELADQARRICRAAALPLLVDADHGYGNALNVMRTVAELETAGVAGLTIEDTDLPPAFNSPGGMRLIPLDEGVAKMRAAIAARIDPDLVIVGRTGALAVSGVNEAIARATAYQAAGVDAIFLAGARSRDQLEALSAALDLPIILGGAGPAFADADKKYLAAHGVRVRLQGHQPYAAAMAAVYTTLKALRAGTSPAELDGLAPPALIAEATNDADYRRWMKEFLAG
jgi:oxaloacetate decarboxylase